MKKRVSILLAMILSVSLLLTGCLGSGTQPRQPAAEEKAPASAPADTNSNGDKITLKLGTSTQTSMPACAAAQRFAEEISKRTNGRITIEFYPARQLGDEAELLQQLMDGTLESALISTSTFSNYTPLLDTLQIPFLLNSYEKEYKAVNSPEMQAIFEGLEEFNVKPLSVLEYGIRHFANNVRPINTPEDVKGLKLRVVPSELILASVKAIGANPTPMAYGEVYTALQTKVIDGEEINLTSIYSEKHYEVLKHVSKIGLWPFPAVLAFNLDFYNKLSAEDQKLLADVAKECLDYNMEQFKEAEKTAEKTIVDSGATLNEVTDLKPFIDATSSIYETYAAKDPRIAAFIKMAQNLQ